ncbi:MAG TPA: hypothetical protein VLF41_01700 [Candidatus Nanoarchaeia archaeon]|nr:hypothetical protein [Candidatus Nanoarchaeia archaeon]
MDKETLQSIHTVMQEISETRGKVKAMRDDSNDVLEQNDEYRTLRDELKEATEKRRKAKQIMADDKDYQALASELEELKFKLKDLQEILSHHLVTYYNQTQNNEFTDPNGDVHQITLSAKIGRG